MALSAGESFSGGQVRDSRSRMVVLSETTNAVLSAGEFYSAGFLCDPDSRTVICQDAAHSALVAGETLTGGDVRDKVGRIACAVETLNAPVSAGSQFSDGWLNDSQGRRIIALDTLGAALGAGEQFTSGQVRDSVGRLVLAAESGGAFDPNSVAGLAGWWKADSLALADGTAVSSLPDSSTGGRPLTQGVGVNQPIFKTAILNGKPIIRFAPTPTFLRSALTLTDGPQYTIFAVAKSTAAGIQSIYDGDDVANGHRVFQFRYESAVQISAVAFNVAVGTFVATQALTATNFNVMSARANAVPEVQVWVNGSAGTAVAITGTPMTGINIAACLGTEVDGANLPLTGDVAEALFYNTGLSNADRLAVENYLRTKYGL